MTAECYTDKKRMRMRWRRMISESGTGRRSMEVSITTDSVDCGKVATYL